MTDPHIPVERGLRATVRMAAGINIGDGEPDDSGVLKRLRALAPSAGPILRPFHDLRDRLAAIDAELRDAMLRHGVIGAAAGTVLVAVGFAALAVEARAKAVPPPIEVATLVVEPIAKADRLTPSGARAATATADLPARPSADLTITTPGADDGTTLAMPALAYASASLRGNAAAAIDRVLEAPPIAAPTLSPGPGALSASEEEDDESVVPLVLPMPRSRPEVAVIESAPLPIPRPRPLVLASLTPPERTELPPGLAEAPTEAPRAASAPRAAEPARPSGGGILGFFSSPTEPVKAPTQVKLDTPFGVPYVLQTGSVETACLKPDLVDILRHIEDHYGQKVVITSGFRDRGRQGSLHRQCAAADIQVPGVPAAKLAAYARTISGIGGVGTYCHPTMIHVDTGTPRDWKYGCGSFFAMRGGTGHWGKVPPTLAKLQSKTQQAASAATEED